jgi:hypothetical protein
MEPEKQLPGSINIDITATPIANTSPKVIRVRPGSSRLATRPRIFKVAKPNTAPEDVAHTLVVTPD